MKPQKKQPMCLRCEVKPAYQTTKFLSAWCPTCHIAKFGVTHEERRNGLSKSPLVNIRKN